MLYKDDEIYYLDAPEDEISWEGIYKLLQRGVTPLEQTNACQFIMGEIGDVTSKYCGLPVLLGKTYCQRHQEITTRKPTEKEIKCLKNLPNKNA